MLSALKEQEVDERNMQEFLNGIDAGRMPYYSDVLEMIDICNRNTLLSARFLLAIDRKAQQSGAIGDRSSQVQDHLLRRGITRDNVLIGMTCALLNEQEMN
jgi:predicted nucleotidyltransferase